MKKTKKCFKTLVPYAYITPITLILVLFVIGSVILSIGLSFTDYNIMTPPVFDGIDNYQKLLGDSKFIKAFKNTLKLMVLIVPFQIVSGVTVATFLVANRKRLLGKIANWIVFIPVLCSNAVVGVVWRELLKQEKLADVIFITTQDRQHVAHAIPAIEKGYHILLEKPISPMLEECKELLRVAKECDRKVVVCHVLRYTPVYQKVKELLDAGMIGEVVSMVGIQNVGWWHQAHSFVRGNWRNSEMTSPIILQKCCHDMDLYLWLAGKECKTITSFGGTHLFKKEKAPEGCAQRCMDGCKVKDSCPYDAESIYIKDKFYGIESGNTGWPMDVLVTGEVTKEAVVEAIKEGPYGRCVYHCDNNVVDHQVLNLEMTDGTVMSFTMCAFSNDISRYSKFMGTKGEIVVYMSGHYFEKTSIKVSLFDAENSEYDIDIQSLGEDFSGHGGGDIAMVKEFIDVLNGEKEESPYVTSLEKSMESHFCALAAEESRINNGKLIDLKNYREQQIYRQKL